MQKGVLQMDLVKLQLMGIGGRQERYRAYVPEFVLHFWLDNTF